MAEPRTVVPDHTRLAPESPEDLTPLPAQPEGVPWPTDRWPEGDVAVAAAERLAVLVDEAFEVDGPLAQTSAVVIVHRGRLVFERYAGVRPEWEGPDTPVGAETTLVSWSMAKSVLHAAVGTCLRDGLLRVDEPPGCPHGRHRRIHAAASHSTSCCACATGWTSSRTT